MDIGVLNLTIKDNSEQAVNGLDQLSDALRRVRDAVASVKLSPVISGIKRLATVVNQNLGGNTITKIRMLANELEKLKGLGDLNIKISSGSSIKSVVDSFKETESAIGGINTGFEDISARAYSARSELEGFNDTMRETVQLMQNTDWSGGLNQFREMFAEMARMRMMFSLPAGEQTGLTTEVEQGWTSWKDGAIEVEGYVDDIDTSLNRLEGTVDSTAGRLYSSTTESVSSAMEQIKMLAMQYETEIGKLYSQLYDENGVTRTGVDIEGILSQIADYDHRIQELADRYRELESVTEQASTAESFSQTTEELYEVRDGFEAATQAAQSYNEAVEFAKQWNASGASASGYHGQESADIEYVNNLIESASEADLLALRIDALRDKLYEMVASGKANGDQIARMVSQIQSLQEKYDNLTNAVDETKRSFTETIFGANGLDGAFKRMFPTLSMLLKRFKSMVIMRSLRYIIRQVSAGFREGVENVYHYSRAVGTDLAPAMDQAATAMQQMKNSIGAAVAPVIQALVPVLQNVVNWFINLINYANQFFALMNGQSTWTRALPEQAEAFEKSTKSAKGASKAMKDLLADWDELNIIQSQTGSGGGSGTGKTSEEYQNMFEEVSEFSDRVKSVLDTINDNLGGLPGILRKAGLFLLGWKFSKAFEGFLGTLGSIIAGGALVTIGVELAYGSGFSAGSKGRWDPEDIIGAIGGALASALGGSLITKGLGLGGGFGFAIGLSAAVVVTLIGYVKGQEDLADKEKWGDLTYTQDQINEFIKNQFTFDRDAEIKIMNAHISDTEGAKRKVKEAVDKFSESLSEAEQVVADVNTTKAETKVAAVKQAAEDAKNAIVALQKYIDENEKGLTYTLTNFKFENAGGEDITDDLLSSIKVADKTLREFFNGEGEKLAKILMEGEKNGWKNGEMEQAVALMESQKRIFDRAEELQGKMKFETETKARLKNVVDRDTAYAMLEEQKKALSEYEETTKQMVTAQADNLLYLASVAESAAIEAGLDTDAGKALHDRAEELKTDAEKILSDLQGAVDRKLEGTRENMAKEWAKTLLAVYGGDVDKSVIESTVPQMDWLFGPVDSAFAEGLKNAGNKGEFIATWLKNETRSFDKNGVILDAMQNFGLNLWDLLSEGARKNLFMNTADILGDSQQATESIMAAFGITKEQVKPYLDNYREYVDEETEKVLKKNNNTTNKPFWQFTPPDSGEVPGVYEAVANANATVTVDKVTLEVDQSAKEELRKQLEDAMSDGVLSGNERQDLGITFGWDLFDEVYNELKQELEKNGPSGALRGGRMIASAGTVSDVGYGKAPYAPTQTAGVSTQADLANGVAAGTERGNQSQNGLLQELISICTRIANKDFTVNITPSSDWGKHNAKSDYEYERVHG